MSIDAISSHPTKSQPWHAAYPVPKSTPGVVTHHEVMSMLKEAGQGSPRDFVLVDVRRNDHEVRSCSEPGKHVARDSDIEAHTI